MYEAGKVSSYWLGTVCQKPEEATGILEQLKISLLQDKYKMLNQVQVYVHMYETCPWLANG